MDQPSAAPSAKLRAVGATGVATAAVLAVAHHYGLAMPEPVAEALVLVGAWLGGYLRRDTALGPLLTQAEAAAGQLLTPAGPRPVALLGSTTQSAQELGGSGGRHEAGAVRGPQAPQQEPTPGG